MVSNKTNSKRLKDLNNNVMITLLVLLLFFFIIYWGAGLLLPANIQVVLGVILGLIWIIKALAVFGILII